MWLFTALYINNDISWHLHVNSSQILQLGLQIVTREQQMLSKQPSLTPDDYKYWYYMGSLGYKNSYNSSYSNGQQHVMHHKNREKKLYYDHYAAMLRITWRGQRGEEKVFKYSVMEIYVETFSWRGGNKIYLLVALDWFTPSKISIPDKVIAGQRTSCGFRLWFVSSIRDIFNSKLNFS